MVGRQADGETEGTWGKRKGVEVIDVRVTLYGLLGHYGNNTKLFYPSLYTMCTVYIEGKFITLYLPPFLIFSNEL